MVWYTLLFILGLVVALYLLLFSRHLVSIKRWYDFSFMLGAALLLWGFSQLLNLNPDPVYRSVATVTTFIYDLFLLLAFRAFPLPPHLYFDRWKNGFDVALLAAIYFSGEYTCWINSSDSLLLQFLLQFQANFFILGSWFMVFAASWNKRVSSNNSLLLIGCLLFILVDSLISYVPGQVLFPIGMIAFVLIVVCDRRKLIEDEKVLVSEDSHYLYEKLNFHLRDERVNWTIVYITVIFLLSMKIPDQMYLAGMILFLILLLIRGLITRRNNRMNLEDLLSISQNLENHFAQNVEQLQKQNASLSRALIGKKRFEKLLQKSNEQNVKTITYDNVHDLIQEYVIHWYMTMNGFTYVRLSLESENGHCYFEVTQGVHKKVASEDSVFVKLIVDELKDSPLTPRFLVVEAEGTCQEEPKIVVEQLALHVCRLFHRCIQSRQDLELRLIEQEMALASKIQYSLIPKERLVLPMAQAKAVYIPMDLVGGDYVDYVEINDRYSCFLIADISGHGVPASLLTTGIRSLFRAVVQTCHTPDEILARLNRLLYEDLSKTRSFVTMFVAVLDQVEGVLRTSRAGHPGPIYLSKSKQMILPCKRGIGLGLTEETVYDCEEIWIEEDFTLFMYTDGLMNLSRKDVNGIEQWLERLSALIQNDGTDLIYEIEQMIWNETGLVEQHDDITVLILGVQKRNQ